MRFASLFVAALLCCGSAVAGDAGRALAQRSVCLACHQVDNKRVGPSFRDIAIRYSGNPAAAEYLARAIRDGSRGLWGAIPMPAQRHIDPPTALKLSEWILSLAPVSPTTGENAGAGDSGGGKSEAGGSDAGSSDVPNSDVRNSDVRSSDVRSSDAGGKEPALNEPTMSGKVSGEDPSLQPAGQATEIEPKQNSSQRPSTSTTGDGS